MCRSQLQPFLCAVLWCTRHGLMCADLIWNVPSVQCPGVQGGAVQLHGPGDGHAGDCHRPGADFGAREGGPHPRRVGPIQLNPTPHHPFLSSATACSLPLLAASAHTQAQENEVNGRRHERVSLPLGGLLPVCFPSAGGPRVCAPRRDAAHCEVRTRVGGVHGSHIQPQVHQWYTRPVNMVTAGGCHCCWKRNPLRFLGSLEGLWGSLARAWYLVPLVFSAHTGRAPCMPPLVAPYLWRPSVPCVL